MKTGKIFLWGGILALVAAAVPASALILTGTGNGPVRDPGWPKGASELADLKSRAGWFEGPPFGGGDWTFLYRGGAVELQEAVDALAKIESKERVVVINEGGRTSEILRDSVTNEPLRYDWSFEVWVPGNWEKLFQKQQGLVLSDHPGFGKSVPPPRLDVFVKPDGTPWSLIKVPAAVTVRDARATRNGFTGGSAIRLKAIDAVTGQAVANARLVVESSADGWKNVERVAKSAPTRSDGMVDVARLAAGVYRISVEADGFVSKVLGHEQIGGNEFREFEARLAETSFVSGTVIDENRRPLEGAAVTLHGAAATDGSGYTPAHSPMATTDASGRFKLAVPKGEVQVSVRLDGYHHQWDPRERIATPAKDLVLRCVPTGTVRIQLVDGDGNPRTGLKPGEANVNIQEAGRTGVGTWGGGSHVDDQGRCEFKNVPVGRYRLSTKQLPDEPQPGESVVEVPDHGVVEVRIPAE